MNNEIEKTVHTIIPAVDIIETKSAYIVTLDIPGAEKEHVKAKIEEDTLIVTAPVSEYHESGKEHEFAKEYRREFSLAHDIDLNTIDAKYELGVLSVTLNKKVQYLPKEININ
jgi:HSP20 family protein